MSKIISIINFKGGVGKTTLSLNIGACLSYFYDKRVLMVDCDPQTNLTFAILPYALWSTWSQDNGTLKTLFEKFISGELDDFSIDKIILKSPIEYQKKKLLPNLDIIPSHLGLLRMDMNLARYLIIKDEHFKDKHERQWRINSILLSALNKIRDHYDLILIDCPPNVNYITQNAIFASDYYIIPSIPDHLSTIGINLLDKIVAQINQDMKNLAGKIKMVYQPARLMGIVFTKVKKANSNQPVILHRRKINEIKSIKRDLCFETLINDSILVPESIEAAVPLEFYSDKRADPIKQQFKGLAEEILQRIPDL